MVVGFFFHTQDSLFYKSIYFDVWMLFFNICYMKIIIWERKGDLNVKFWIIVSILV